MLLMIWKFFDEEQIDSITFKAQSISKNNYQITSLVVIKM